MTALSTALVALALVLLPLLVRESFALNALILTLLFATAAQAWNLIGGYAGQLSFGHAVFFGLGAYTSSILLGRYGITPWLGAPSGAVVATVVSLLIGFATFRLHRHFFALATLALGEIARITFLNWEYVGAAIGLYIPLQYRNQLAFAMWDTKPPYYFTALGLFALVMGLAMLVDRRRMGLYLKAINQDEGAAQALGIDSLRYKEWAMGASAAFTALAGSLYAQYVLYIDPYNVFTGRVSLLVVVMALIGGRATVWGPVMGAAFITLLSEYARVQLAHLGQGYDFILFGLVIMTLSIYEPKGLMGLTKRKRSRPIVNGNAYVRADTLDGALKGTSRHGESAETRTATMDAILETRGLAKRFGGIVALHGVDLTVRTGEILGLIGPNGAGKSTLFDCITGFQRPDEGEVRLRNESITGAAAHEPPQRGLVRTFQLIRVFPDLTARENLKVAQSHRNESVWAALGRTRPEVEAQAIKLLSLVGLASHQDVPAGQLSYGQQKLLSLAMVLMTGAQCILLDEPTAGVNPYLAEELTAHLHDLNRSGLTLVVIEHNMDVINALAGRVYFMAGGRILAEGTPSQIQQNPMVLEAYYGR